METDRISTIVFACGHEIFVPVTPAKWTEKHNKPIHLTCKCDSCDFPRLLLRFRNFNNPSNKLCLDTAGKLAFEMFESRHCLSVESIDALTRHWMRALQCHIFGEVKWRALFDGLEKSVATQVSPLAGKQMRAMLDSGYVRFIKNGRGYSRMVARSRPTIRIPALPTGTFSPSSTGTPDSPSTSSSSISGFRTPSRQMGSHHRYSSLASTPMTSPPSNYKSSGTSTDHWTEVNDKEEEEEEEEEEDEDTKRLRAALEKLHKALEDHDWNDHWGPGNREAQVETIEKYCHDMNKSPRNSFDLALHRRRPAKKDDDDDGKEDEKK
ncbi:hypothetical protein GGS20DRAFT_589974 [Poronia punctata]|nr:hypothetical protein GGS20DRAFT_589974 [Poronia punctata]